MLTRRALALLLLFTPAGAARADVAPPPGKKRLPVTRTFQCDKMPDGYAFYTAWWESGVTIGPRGRPIPPEERKGEPAPKPHWVVGPVRFEPGVPRSIQGTLYAVPVDAVPKHVDGQFAESLSKGKVPGAFRYPHDSLGNEVPVADPRKEIIIRDVIERIDPEKGVVVKRTTNAPDEPGKTTNTRDEDGTTPDSPTATRDWLRSPAVWVAASSAALGLALAGVWLVGRNRRA
jgi:hypothetical protein